MIPTNKMRFSTYNEGVATFCKKKELTKNVKTLDDLVPLNSAFYNEMSKRQEDIDFAEQKGQSLSLKIKTPYFGDVPMDCNVVVGNVIYAIINSDYSRENNEMYFYLEEVRKLD